MKKCSFLTLILFAIPFVKAEEECGIMNLATCIPQKLYDYFLNIINSPIQPLLTAIKNLLTAQVNISIFGSVWAIIIYILSLFYGLLLLYSGFQFMLSGHDVAKREKAKEWFRNVFLMIVLVQASYFLYSLVIDINSLLTSGIINLVDSNFFLLTADNITNLGLQLFFGLIYGLTLLITIVMLSIRYIIVSVGVVFIPLGIFFFFIPPLKDYGKLIFNFLGICIFTTFIDSLIFLAGSKLSGLDVWQDFKILVMISSFGIANLAMLYFMLFSAIKSALSTGDKISGTIVSVAKYFA